LSIGSSLAVGSLLSFLSVGSVLSSLSRWSVLAWRGPHGRAGR
jgi:hypothetical protein